MIRSLLNPVFESVTLERVLSLARYAPDNLPTTDDAGSVYFDTSRNIPVWWDGDKHEWPSYVDNDDVKTSAVTVSNTTDETEIFRFGLDQGALEQGRIGIIRCFGKYNTAASTDNFTYRVYLGEMGFDPISAGDGTSVTAVSTVQENVTDGPWQMKTTATVFSEGSSGTIATHSEGSFNNTKSDDHADPATVDTTTGEEIVGTVQWNNAKTDNTVTRGQAYLQQQA